jgi:hypothetical protein
MQATNHSIVRKSVYYKQVLDFLRPVKILCQTSGVSKSLVPSTDTAFVFATGLEYLRASVAMS